ncbi:acyl-CoA dehydrogenase/oxidase C-terminal [Lipomyces japonicus]|uniref:acyl-CoA dehydrogenase/oxidase C-terminal n=1 Tax=Lipomyces japonicus TaxID=56871 RepID=UPI0034CE25C1
MTWLFNAFYIAQYIPGDILKNVVPDLQVFGDYVVSEEIFSWVADAERNCPHIEQFDAFGNRINKLVTTNGWKKLKDIAAKEGLFSRIIQFSKYYLYCPSSAVFTCPLAMTDGLARVLEIYEPDHNVLQHLTTRDPSQFWTSGQWMTERSGGSDVSGTETFATKVSNEINKYLISGFKWFSSATDSNVAILLARENETENLSCFLGYALPTAELELNGLHAELIGPRTRGVPVIATVLTITRIHNSVSAISFLRRALEIAKEFSKVRKVSGTLLHNLPAHVRTLAEIEVQLRAVMQFTYFCVSLLGKVECHVATKEEKFLLRILTSVVKAATAKICFAGVSECMEGLGGVGYLENEPEINIARLERDAQVLSIWEGTTNVLSDDFIRALKRRQDVSLQILTGVIEKLTFSATTGSLAITGAYLRAEFKNWKTHVERTNVETLRIQARVVLLTFNDLICGSLLVADAARDNDIIATEVARRFVFKNDNTTSFGQKSLVFDYASWSLGMLIRMDWKFP